ITETDVAPQVMLNVSQAVTLGNTIYQPDGAVTVVANATDGNGDAMTFSWVGTDTSLLNAVGTMITANQLVFDPGVLTLDGLYTVKVTVNDGTSDVSVERLLQISVAPAALTAVDTDGDGVNDDDASEGYGDDDADGIPNYLDHLSTPANAIENHTINLATSLLIETDPGLHIARGQTAVAVQASGVLIGMQDITDHGGAGGIAVTNAGTDHTFISGLLNFKISGLTESIESIHVVIPLQSAIQDGAVYRKYNQTGWFDFVEDDLNELNSAAGNDGSCPQPGSNLYAAGMTVGHLCLQLTIQDGGANDADGVRNFVVRDPGGLALAPEAEVTAEAADNSGRVGSVSLWFMLMLAILAATVWQQRVKHRVRSRIRINKR
ncbi:MAG: hypothetical protein KAT12_02560, partial [Gammaproteobacteria bacterium]|nr:hypothetical protein [Gammaproteobacteria bacterium]